MESNNKVSVKIYGQEYVIAGEESREHIVKVAAYVDSKMHEIGNAVGSCPVSSLAVLSAVNIADEHFENVEEIEELKKLNVQLEKDAQHYVQLWDEAKKSYLQYKEETQSVIQQKDDLLKEVAEKEKQIEDLKEANKYAESEIEKKKEEAVAEVEDRCRELENSFFDLQMENLQLKKELDAYKRNME